MAIVGCIVFGLQSLPTASAAKGGSAGSTATSAGEGATAATRRAERQAAKAEGAPVPPAVAPPSVEASAPPAAAPHGRRGQPAPPPAPPFVQSAGAAAHKGDRPVADEHAQRREGRREGRHSTSSSAGSGASPAVAVTSDESSAGQAEAFARKQKKGGGGGKGKKEHKEKGKKQPPEEGSNGEGSGSGAEGSSGANAKGKGADLSAPAAQVSATAASLAPIVAPASGTGPASVSSALPAAKAGLAGGLAANHAGRHVVRRARKASSGAAAAVASAPASPLLASQTSTSAAAPSSRASHTHAKSSKQGSTQPALVKTFTKIVGVVPTPVRILIGALILLALMLGVRSLLSGVRTRRLVRQRGQLLEDVGLLQAALLPVPPARLGPIATSVAYRPADGPGAGGDFYDVFALEDGEIAVIVGDVSGHGREALPHTALLRFTVRAYLEAGLSPRKALQTAGGVLDRQLAGSFATVLAATYNPRERKLTYASAGHPPPVVLGNGTDGAAEAPHEGEKNRARVLAPVTSCSAPPIGAGMRTGTRQTVVSVPGPARLCFHTDGVTEARIGGDLFGAERLAAALSGLQHDADADALLDRVAEQSDARPDDMAACLLRVHDGHGTPAIVLEQLELHRELLSGGRVERFLLDCGVELGEAESLVRDARRRLQCADSAMLELARGADGRPVASIVDDNVIHAAALAAAAGAS